MAKNFYMSIGLMDDNYISIISPEYVTPSIVAVMLTIFLSGYLVKPLSPAVFISSG